MYSNIDFSVLLAVYGKDDPYFFRNALSSIFLNTLQPKELVIVADGDLTIDLLNVVHDFSKNHPINFIQLPFNVGLARALNIGLSKIKTKYTIRADADDFNYSCRFQILFDALCDGYDLVGSAIRELDKDGFEVAFRYCPLIQSDIKAFSKRRNPFNHMSVGFRTSAVIDAGGYPPIYLKEDYALWATLISRGAKVCNLRTVLVDAMAGTEMFRRRGGVKYAVAEIDLQCHLVRCRLKSPLRATFDGLLRAVIFLAPNVVREFFYLTFLRAKKD